MGLYSSFRGKSFANETGKLTAALFLDGMAMIALLYVIQIINFSRWALAIFLALDFLIVLLKRFILRKTLRKFRESGYNRKYVLIVGSGHAARDKPISNPSLHMDAMSVRNLIEVFLFQLVTCAHMALAGKN